VGIRPEFRWWILTVIVVAVLLGISALALDRPNVVWQGDSALCPHCRTEVPSYSSRCPTCEERYDWTPVPDETSPRSRWSLSTSEAQFVRERIETLGPEAAAARAAAALEISPASAALYLEHIGRGRCGWCGGTGRDLATEEGDAPCPVCFGRKACIACGGDLRVRVGDEGAHRALTAYRRELDAISVWIPADVQREEARDANQEFLPWHVGTGEASQLVFWPWWPRDKTTPAVAAARRRLDALLTALTEGE
jgi:hypothetical protein